MGGASIWVLHILAYRYWVYPEDRPVRGMIDGRSSSFGNILAEVYFSEDPDVFPTPAELAIGLFLMIKIMLLPGRFPVWPSMLIGTVRELNRETGRSGAVMGEITILNAPVGSAKGISLSENNVTHSSNLDDVMGGISIDFGTGGKEHIDAGAPIDEKVWLDCFSILMFHAFSHVHTELVARTFVAGTTTTWYTDDHSVRYTFSTTVAAASELTWDDVALSQLCILREWAKTNVWRSMEVGEMLIHGQLAAKIIIVAIKTVARDNSTNSVAAA